MSESSLVPERQLVFSPGLAATIGLEEAILLQHLQELLQHGTPQLQRGFAWLSVEREFLLRTLPFWQAIDLHRITRSLVDKGVLLMESPPIHSTERLIFALNEPVAQHPSAPAVVEPPPQRRSAGLMPMHWSPSEDLLQLLALNHTIPRQFALDQLEDFVFYWRERGEPNHAWENKFRQHVISHWRRHQQDQAEAFRVPEPTKLDGTWRPSADAREILDRSEIDQDFINQAIPEFILYWRERGAAPKELNSKFIQHIRIQWVKFNSAMEHSTEPKRINDQWFPSEDVFDILTLSHIDADFARTLLPEFIVYWKDSNQAQTSWNTKYIQHVKYHWAKRHQMEQAGQSNAGQPGSNQTSRTRDRSLEQDLTDTSWAE
ncbi:MAG: DnaT-like ssDNA-binding domain-containing protein [Halioglobus sp.]